MAESEIKVSQELTEKRVPITRENVKFEVAGAVSSVNGQTGDVVLTAEDVGALPDTTEIPTSTSDLANDSDFQTGQQVADAIAIETTAREEADGGLQGQIDALSAASDVTDIVGTYAALQAYDTSKLKDNDIIKVLQDEQHDNETTYYRWSATTQTFTLIGEEGPYYTKAAADAKFQDKLTAGTNINIDANNEISATDTTYSAGTGLDLTGTVFSVNTTAIQEKLTAGANITIANDNTISATDTTYSDFTGTDGQTAGTAGLVPAPATTDAGKFLKADGTWDTAGGGSSVNVVQTIGTSTTDVMSQDAVTNELYDAAGNIRLGASSTASASTGPNIIIGKGDSALAGNYGKIIIGDNITDTNAQPNTIEIGSRASSASSGNIAIGLSANSGSGSEAVAFGSNSSCRGESRATAIGANAKAGRGGVALGAYSQTTRNGEVNIGSTNTSWGYNSTNYRVLGGVHPAVDDHDAVTLGQLNSRILAGGTAAPTTSTVGAVGALYAYVESGTGHLAICTAADTSTSTYTWQTLI